MSVSINDLSAYSERIGVTKKAERQEPLLTIREFNLMTTAVRYYMRHGLDKQEGETFKQRHRRLVSRAELDSALNKLRTLTPQRYE